jgi:hypothetical protein
MRHSAKLTKLFIWVVMTVAIGLDVYWAINDVPGDTISEVTKGYSWKWATIPVSFGVLTGHLFWSTFGTVKWKYYRLAVLWGIGLVVVAADILNLYDVMPIIPLVPSILLGRLLWPQPVASSQPLVMWNR